MDRQKINTIARKVEALAIEYIGVAFFSFGTANLQERLIYQVPRILVPVFDWLGNVGVAIAMMILGIGIIFYGFAKWKSISGKRSLYWILAVIGLVVGVALANFNFNPNKSANIINEMDKNRDEQIDKIRNSGELNFKNTEVDEHIANYNILYKRYEQSLKDKDEAAITACEKEFSEWVSKTGDIVQRLNSMDEKTELARYQAKLAIQWNDLKMKQ